MIVTLSFSLQFHNILQAVIVIMALERLWSIFKDLVSSTNFSPNLTLIGMRNKTDISKFVIDIERMHKIPTITRTNNILRAWYWFKTFLSFTSRTCLWKFMFIDPFMGTVMNNNFKGFISKYPWITTFTLSIE